MKRLIETLNTAAGNCLTQARLDKAFELCYPDLEKSLDGLKTLNISKDEDASRSTNTHLDSSILEELLEMGRNTQRLLGNTDSKLYSNIDQVQKKMDDIINRMDKKHDMDTRRTSSKVRPYLIEDLLFQYENQITGGIFPYNILMVLAMYKEDFPWLYDAGRELFKIIVSNAKKKEKMDALDKFRNILEYTFEHPMMREIYGTRKEAIFLMRELPFQIAKEIERKTDGI